MIASMMSVSTRATPRCELLGKNAGVPLFFRCSEGKRLKAIGGPSLVELRHFIRTIRVNKIPDRHALAEEMNISRVVE